VTTLPGHATPPALDQVRAAVDAAEQKLTRVRAARYEAGQLAAAEAAVTIIRETSRTWRRRSPARPRSPRSSARSTRSPGVRRDREEAARLDEQVRAHHEDEQVATELGRLLCCAAAPTWTAPSATSRATTPPTCRQNRWLLRPGQRTPAFTMGTSWRRTSWYLQLPRTTGVPWSGVVRLECSADVPVPEVTRLADLTARVLPPLASVPHKDPRAPQNLVPIGGPERELRHRLGDQHVLYRALRAAAMSAR
jgi:hypothetical protein